MIREKVIVVEIKEAAIELQYMTTLIMTRSYLDLSTSALVLARLPLMAEPRRTCKYIAFVKNKKLVRVVYPNYFC